MNTIERALEREKEKLATSDEQLAENSSVKQDTTIAKGSTIEKAVSQDTTRTPRSMSNEAEAILDHEPDKIILDLESLEQKGFVSLSSQRKLINEEFRAIKRKLLNNAFGAISSTLKNSNIIIVTSSKPGEGKTFTSVNLALSIALEQDKTVLLVDADVLKPNMMNTLGQAPKDGLIEYLLGEKTDIAQVMYKTNSDKLKIIPAGRTHHLSAELLSSEKMFKTVTEFANRYNDRVVIIDAPPLLGINESAILANLAGQAVIVTEEGKSKLSDIQAAVAQLNQDMAIGFIVNKAQKQRDEDHGYGYYYSGAN